MEKTHPAEANGKGIIWDMNTVVESSDLGWEGVCSALSLGTPQISSAEPAQRFLAKAFVGRNEIISIWLGGEKGQRFRKFPIYMN